ncbi:MAG: hypothetical protein PHD65_04875 [Gallionella sp.]|nr:hypothetical protein [Gallionella sp.]
MRLSHKKYCNHETVCKPVARFTPYARTLLLLCVCAAPVAAEAAPQPPAKWQLVPASSASGDALTLSLKAEKAVDGWMKSAVPVLTIQCEKGKASLYVEAGMALEVTVVDKQLVRLQFDNDKSFPQSWREVTNSTLSARDAAPLIQHLARSQKFIFEFIPFTSPSVKAEFDVAGLSAYSPQLDKACWKK